MCRVKRPPMQGPFFIEWESVHEGSNPGEPRLLHRDVNRGGVKVETGMDDRSGNLISRISLASARKEDAGNYTCRLGGVPPDIQRSYPRLEDTIVLHVLNGEITKAIHSNEAPGRLVSSGATFYVITSLLSYLVALKTWWELFLLLHLLLLLLCSHWCYVKSCTERPLPNNDAIDFSRDETNKKDFVVPRQEKWETKFGNDVR